MPRHGPKVEHVETELRAGSFAKSHDFERNNLLTSSGMLGKSRRSTSVWEIGGCGKLSSAIYATFGCACAPDVVLEMFISIATSAAPSSQGGIFMC